MAEKCQNKQSLSLRKQKFKNYLNNATIELFEYLKKKEKENEEYDVESPVYLAELESCKTIGEIKKYMKEFQ